MFMKKHLYLQVKSTCMDPYLKQIKIFFHGQKVSPPWWIVRVVDTDPEDRLGVWTVVNHNSQESKNR